MHDGKSDNNKLMRNKIARNLRKFGLTMAVAFAVFGVLFLWREKQFWPYMFYISAFFGILGLIYPRILSPVEWVWMKMAHYIGLITTPVILTLTFYLVVTPMALIMRLIGKDILRLKRNPMAETYWIPVDPKGPASRPDKPY